MSFKVKSFEGPVCVMAPGLKDIDEELGLPPKIIGPADPATTIHVRSQDLFGNVFRKKKIKLNCEIGVEQKLEAIAVPI